MTWPLRDPGRRSIGSPVFAAEIDDIYIGCAMPEGEQGMNVARIAAFRAGIPHTVPAMTLNRFCSSGLQSIAFAAERIIAGGAHCIMAGGTESMSMIPMGGQKIAPNPTLVEEQSRNVPQHGTDSRKRAHANTISAVTNRTHLRLKATGGPCGNRQRTLQG